MLTRVRYLGELRETVIGRIGYPSQSEVCVMLINTMHPLSTMEICTGLSGQPSRLIQFGINEPFRLFAPIDLEFLSPPPSPRYRSPVRYHGVNWYYRWESTKNFYPSPSTNQGTNVAPGDSFGDERCSRC